MPARFWHSPKAAPRHWIASAYAIVMRRSTDGGISWSPPTAIYSGVPNSGTRYGSPVPVVDQTTGKIFVIFTRNNSDVLVTTSTDDGLTWTSPTDITSSVKVTAAGNPGPPGDYSNTPWQWYTPTDAIQLQHGPAAGRILVVADHRETADNSGQLLGQRLLFRRSWSNLASGRRIIEESRRLTLAQRQLERVGAGRTERWQRLHEQPHSDSQTSINRGASLSHDGGITWSTMTLATEILSNRVEGSLLRLDSNVILFASPSSADGTRHDLTIWGSYDDAQSWIKLKDVDFGPSGYSSMVLVGPDTLLLAYTHGFSGGATIGGGDNNGISPVVRQQSRAAPHQLAVFAELRPLSIRLVFQRAGPRSAGPSQHALRFEITARGTRGRTVVNSGLDPAPKYVAGAAGDTALELVGDSNKVVLTPGGDNALQFDVNDSFTVEIVMKTTDSSGVIIGTRPTIKNWTLQVVGGKVQFSVSDLVTTPTITANAAISDGQWHRVEAVRDATSHLLKLYVDGVEAATPVADTTTQARNAIDPIDPVTLGDYNTQGPSNPLTFDVDTVRVTRAALASGVVPAVRLRESDPIPRARLSVERAHFAAGAAVLVAALRFQQVLRRLQLVFRSASGDAVCRNGLARA